MIFVDANIILTYLVAFVATGKDGRQRRRPVLVQRSNREAVVAFVDAAIKSGDLRITCTAADEAHRNAWKAIVSAAKDAGATAQDVAKFTMEVQAKIVILRRRFGVGDNKSCIEKARSAYARAWSDERMRGAIEIRRLVKEMRGKDASMPTPEKNEGDFVILSTAAYWAARGYKARLPTFDRDLVALSAAIREGLGVDVVDCGRLGR